MHPFIFLCSFGLLFSLPFQSLFASNLPDSNIDHPSPFDINSEQKKSFETVIKATKYAYVMKVDFQTDNGETKMSTFATLDTGSDLIWLNSTNCTGDIYGYCKDSQAKCTRETKCEKCDTFCEELSNLPPPKDQTERPACSEHTCPYNTSYADNFTTQGNLTRSEFFWSFSDSDVKKPYEIWFGVPTVARGKMERKKSAGIVGLGLGNLSLISQLIRQEKLDLSLSYCLPPSNSPSSTKLRIGNQATISDKFVNLLPKTLHEHCTNRYCVSLAQISIYDGKTPHDIQVSNEILLIDTGTTLTYFHKKLFKDFIKMVKGLGVGKSIRLGKYSHCFEKKNGEKLKKVSLIFDNKMSIELEPINYFVDRKHKEIEYNCLTVKENKIKGMPNLLGSWAQVNFNVVIGDFDKDDGNGRVSFEKKVCVEEHKEEEVLDFQE